VATDDEFGRHYSFFEESIPAYLWLAVAQEQIQTQAAPAPADPVPGAAAQIRA
jgi:hypothetical protein